VPKAAYRVLAGLRLLPDHPQIAMAGGVSWSAPAIVLNAADEPFAVMIDFNERALALATIVTSAMANSDKYLAWLSLVHEPAGS